MADYKGYIDYITAGGMAETAYMISHEGAICGTNLPIQAFPSYEFDLEDDNGKVNKIVVDERVNLIDALNKQGVCPHAAGIRLYNQKYYLSHYDGDNNTYYLKKVHLL